LPEHWLVVTFPPDDITPKERSWIERRLDRVDAERVAAEYRQDGCAVELHAHWVSAQADLYLRTGGTDDGTTNA